MGGALARVPHRRADRAALGRAALGGGAGRCARGRDRPGPRLRHRRARDHAALPRAACSTLAPGSLLDVGCGSGVLSIAAAKLGFGPVVAIDHDPQAVEATRANAAANGVEVDARLVDATVDPLPPSRRRRRERRARAGRGARAAARRVDADLAPATWTGTSPACRAGARADASHRRRVGGRPIRARVKCGAMATFSVRFLGCKVSHTDAHAVRERLLADGHDERDDGADVAVVNTCCVTHEAVRKSRHAAARARALAQPRLRHRLRREPRRRRVRRPARERRRRRAPQRGDAGVRRRRRRRDRLRPGRRPARPRSRLRQGAGRLLLLLQLLRDPARARRLAQPPRRGGARRGAAARRAGAPRGRPDRDQPRLLPRPRGRLRARRGSCARRARRRASSGCGSRRSRSTT